MEKQEYPKMVYQDNNRKKYKIVADKVAYDQAKKDGWGDLEKKK